jgi:hypothetical protein
MTARRPATYVIAGAVFGVVLLFGVIALLLGATASAPPPVSNPGNGIEGTLQTPPPRYDWTDE